MDDTPDPQFAAWMKAERASYEAVHQLHQRTHGGRLLARAEAFAEITALRREADRRLAELCRSRPAGARTPDIRDAAPAPRPFRMPAGAALRYEH